VRACVREWVAFESQMCVRAGLDIKGECGVGCGMRRGSLT
jgi:hypothetical protein